MRLIGSIDNIINDYDTNTPKITLKIDYSDIFDEDELNELAKQEKINIDLTRFVRKRKLSQNDMSWVLQKQLAKKLDLGNEELHDRLIKEYSEYDIVSLLSDIDPSKYFDYYEEYDKRIGQNGRQYTFYKIYIPSHKMTTKQFSRYMDGIIRECEDNGIHTIQEKK